MGLLPMVATDMKNVLFLPSIRKWGQGIQGKMWISKVIGVGHQGQGNYQKTKSRAKVNIKGQGQKSKSLSEKVRVQVTKVKVIGKGSQEQLRPNMLWLVEFRPQLIAQGLSLGGGGFHYEWKCITLLISQFWIIEQLG